LQENKRTIFRNLKVKFKKIFKYPREGEFSPSLFFINDPLTRLKKGFNSILEYFAYF